jgi:regulatory protein
MTVTSVKKQRGCWYNVELDGAQTVKVDRRTWDESPYREGTVLDDEALHALLAASARRRVWEKAIWYLSLRDYTKQELAKKLYKEAEHVLVDETVEALLAKGFIREEAYARALATERVSRQHRPRRRVQQELVQRGVDRDLAAQIVNEIATDDLQEALALLEKKRYTDNDMQKRRQKACGFLTRQGFDYATVRKAWEIWAETHGEIVGDDGGFDDEL